MAEAEAWQAMQRQFVLLAGKGKKGKGKENGPGAQCLAKIDATEGKESETELLSVLERPFLADQGLDLGVKWQQRAMALRSQKVAT